MTTVMHQEERRVNRCPCLVPDDGVLMAFVVLLDDLDDETFDELARLAGLLDWETR